MTATKQMMKRIHLKSCTSTNDIAWEYLESGAQSVLVTADTQTQGRGRQQRPWISNDARNLYASYGKFYSGNAPQAIPYAMIAAVAIFESFANLDPHFQNHSEVRIKWPNDLIYKNKKWGGVLAEGRTSADHNLSIVVGFGLNLIHAPSLDTINHSSSYEGATCLSEIDTKYLSLICKHSHDNPQHWVHDFLKEWVQQFETLSQALPSQNQWLALWKKWARWPNFRQTPIRTANGLIYVEAQSILEDGSLVALENQQEKVFRNGE